MFKNDKTDKFVSKVISIIFNFTTEVFDRMGVLVFFVLMYAIILTLAPFLLLYNLISNIITMYKEEISIDEIIATE